MAVFTTSTFASGLRSVDDLGDELGAFNYVAPGVTLGAGSGNAIKGDARDQTALIAGTAYSDKTSAIVLRGAHALVTVAEGGLVASHANGATSNLRAAVVMSDVNPALRNLGLVLGGNAVHFTLYPASVALIENQGTLSGLGLGANVTTELSAAIYFRNLGASSSRALVNNDGTIEGAPTAGYDRRTAILETTGTAAASTVEIDNTGLIRGDILLAAGYDTLVNTGRIAGQVSMPGSGLVNNSGEITGTLSLSEFADFVLNSGRLGVGVSLGDGADYFDGRGGFVGTFGVSAGAGGDRIWAGWSDDYIFGDAGADTIDGGIGNDTVYGGSEDDILRGGTGDDSLAGGDGNDSLRGDDGEDSLSGDAGDDILRGDGAEDWLAGGTGADHLRGGEGDDTVSGGDGNDLVHGDAGGDWLAGGTGNDTLRGNDGADTLTGEAGYDLLDGGAGPDVFRFVTTAQIGRVAGSRDRVLDLAAGDVIDLSAIDANTATAGNAAFVLIGAAGFGGIAGQLLYDAAAGVVAGDVNGDGRADFALELLNRPALADLTFLL